jgi:hypothetical protein
MTWRSLGDSNPCFRRERAVRTVRGAKQHENDTAPRG